MKQDLLRRSVNKVIKAKKSIHQRTIGELVTRMLKSGNYDVIDTCVEYGLPNNPNALGEIDLYAIKKTRKDTYLLLFEIKSTNSIKNKRFACEQLERQERLLGDNADRIFKFYVTPHKHNIKTISIEWIKKPRKNW